MRIFYRKDANTHADTLKYRSATNIIINVQYLPDTINLTADETFETFKICICKNTIIIFCFSLLCHLYQHTIYVLLLSLY